jgi:hypothetical protein
LEDGVTDYVKNYLLKNTSLGYWEKYEWEKNLNLFLTPNLNI